MSSYLKMRLRRIRRLRALAALARMEGISRRGKKRDFINKIDADMIDADMLLNHLNLRKFLLDK
jgi:hypothetical protein